MLFDHIHGAPEDFMDCAERPKCTHSFMQGWGSMDGVWDGPFLEWVGRSQLYSADLLAPDAAKDLEQWMQCAAPADKRQMMALLRDLHATVTPTGYDGSTLPCTFVFSKASPAV